MIKIKATFKKYILQFKLPGGTSRGVLHTKETFFLKIIKDQNIGIGECAVFKGLSVDDRPDYEEKLQWLCDHIHLDKEIFIEGTFGISIDSVWVGAGIVVCKK